LIVRSEHGEMTKSIISNKKAKSYKIHVSMI